MWVNDAQTLVLCALTGGPLHGYAINAAIIELTGEGLGPGSLYGALIMCIGANLFDVGAISLPRMP